MLSIKHFRLSLPWKKQKTTKNKKTKTKQNKNDCLKTVETTFQFYCLLDVHDSRSCNPFILIFQSAKMINFAATRWSLNDFPSPFENY